jgi:hypothetical protein
MLVVEVVDQRDIQRMGGLYARDSEIPEHGG